MPLRIEPGQEIIARIPWRNGGPVRYSPQFRLEMKMEGMQVWSEGPWVSSPEILPGESIAIEVSHTVPAHWYTALIDVRVVASGGGERVLNPQEGYFQTCVVPPEYNLDPNTGNYYYDEWVPAGYIRWWINPTTCETWQELIPDFGDIFP